MQTAGREKRGISTSEDIRLERIKGEIFDVDSNLAKAKTEMRMLSSGQDDFHIDSNNYSITRAIRMAGSGRLEGYEAECSQEIQQRTGKAPDGIYIPQSALVERRSGMSVTNDSGGYGGSLVATEKLGFIDALRPMLAVARMGATLMSGLTSNVGIPRQSAASTATWKSETGELDEQTPALDEVDLTPHRIGCWTKFSKQLLVQSSPDIEAWIKNDLMLAIATGFDYAAINGSGSSNQPTGILNTSGIGSVAGGTNGLAPTWSNLTALVAAVVNADAVGSKPGFMFNTKTEAKLRSTPKVASTDSRMVLEENQTTLVGQPWYASNNVPSNLTKGSASGVCSAIIYGNWADCILASFGLGVDMVVDPFTHATSGQNRIVLNALADVGIRRGASFGVIKDVLTT